MIVSLAARTRAAVRRHPFILTALRAGVLNHAAAARFLDLDGDPDAIAAALRRFGQSLPAFERTDRTVTVRMRRSRAAEFPLISIDGSDIDLEADETLILVTGDVEAVRLAPVLSRLAAEGIEVITALATRSVLAVTVANADGAAALKHIEDTVTSAPNVVLQR